MFTQCPHCNTAFSITEEQLAIARGVVRCGLCQELFEADKHLIAQTGNVDSSKRDLERVAALATKPTESPAPATNNRLAQQISPKADQTEHSDVSELLLEETGQHKGTGNHPVYALMALGALLVLGLQISLLYAAGQLPAELRNLSCNWLQCPPVVSRRDTDAIEILNRGVYSHPQKQGALMVTATLVNRAKFAQPFPKVGLVLLDIYGHPVAGRLFDPDEYLSVTEFIATDLKADQIVALELEIEDPGKRVIGYEFSFY